MSAADKRAEFWAGKRVLVTGHTGFKGAWLCLWLEQLKARVAGYALPPPTVPSLFELIRAGESMSSVCGDVRDLDRLARTLADFTPDIVFHLAAQSLVRASYRDPVTTYTTNVLGTVNVLEAIRRCPSVRVAINITSDKCYQLRAGRKGFVESDALGGHDPYSSSKACAELVTAAYRHSFFSDGPAESRPAVATVRAGNVIGGGDWAPDRLVPDCVRAMSANQPIVVRNPNAVRPWQHVLDPLGGYLLLAERMWRDGGEFADSWNFGPDAADALPVRELADRITSLWGGGARWVRDEKPGPFEAPQLRLDCAKAAGRLGWSPRLRLAEALEWTVDWYRRCHGGEDARTLAVEQIHQFMSLEKPAHA
jgi:CDP-glucose 4,6-dehydratase